MKRILLGIAAVAFAFAMTACGDSNMGIDASRPGAPRNVEIGPVQTAEGAAGAVVITWNAGANTAPGSSWSIVRTVDGSEHISVDPLVSVRRGGTWVWAGAPTNWWVFQPGSDLDQYSAVFQTRLGAPDPTNTSGTFSRLAGESRVGVFNASYRWDAPQGARAPSSITWAAGTTNFQAIAVSP